MFKNFYKLNFLIFVFSFFLSISNLFSIDDNLFKSNIFFDRAKEVLDEVCQIQSSYVPEILDLNNDVQFDQVIDLGSSDSDEEDFCTEVSCKEESLELAQDINEENLDKNISNIEPFDDAQAKLVSVSNELQKDPIEQNFNKTYLYKQIKFVLSKLSFYKFASFDMSSRRLEILLREIDDLQDDFLDVDKSFLLQESIDKLNGVFDLLRRGIACELSFDHLMIFRENLINHMRKILELTDYWMMELHHNSFIERVKNSFQYYGEEELKLKIKKLNFIKDRVASYIGKSDELFLLFFKEMSSLAEDGENNIYKTSESLNNFVDESIFCINSFFSQKFDPDKGSYTQNIADLEKGSFVEFIKLLCQNHVNVQLIEGTCKHQIKEFRIPSFLRRHWLMLTVFGTATAVGGGYLYCNWGWLTGDEDDSPKNRVIDMGTKSSEWIFESFGDLKKMAKDKFWPDANKKDSDDPESLRTQLKGELDKLKKSREGFMEGFKNKCAELKARGVDLPVDLDELAKLDTARIIAALENFKKDYMKVGHDNVSGGAQDIVDRGRDLNRRINEIAGAADFGALPGGNRLTAALNDSSHLLSQLGAFLDRVKGEDGPGNQALNSLNTLLDSITAFINTFPVQIENVGALGEIYEVIIYKLIADILGLADFGVDKIIEKVDDTAKTAQVTLNWIKALVPVLITTIVIPMISILTIRKIMNNREKSRYNRINNMISEIYRTLNYYNSQSFDCYHKELRYKDQGMLGFWIEMLNGKTNTVSLEDKKRLLNLISDMQNPDFSVSQKIEFIKLEWGKHLFAGSAII